MTLAVLSCMWTPARGVHVSAASAILVDAVSGRVLYAYNANQVSYIASITKLMTALVAVESGHALDESVTILPDYVGAEGSSMYLTAGETLTFEALLYGLLLASGNDAAQAIAGFCAGSVEAFVAQMNRRAATLGMTQTKFINPSGLTEEGHCSTASDMAKLAIACMDNRIIADMVSTKSMQIAGRSFTNHNKLLWQYDGCVGMKTGYTQRSGRTLISCAKREDQCLIAVTLDDPDDWRDHAAMLDYGFETYANCELISAGEQVTKVPIGDSILPFSRVVALSGVTYPLAEGEQVRREVSVFAGAKAPVRRGDTAGTVTFYLGDTLIGMCPLVHEYPINSDRAAGGGWLWKLIGRLLD